MDKNTPIVIGADNMGLPLKNAIRDYLVKKGYKVDDMGVNASDPVDYPDVAAALAEAVAAGQYERGILVCGTGAGMAIVANKVPGVRAVLRRTIPTPPSAAVASNNAQIITLGSQITRAVRGARRWSTSGSRASSRAAARCPRSRRSTAWTRNIAGSIRRQETFLARRTGIGAGGVSLRPCRIEASIVGGR